MKTKQIVINDCYGGFGLSNLAYEKLIEWGVPVGKYIQEKRGKDGLYKDEPRNKNKIFDRKLTPKGEDDFNDLYYKYPDAEDRYWDTWIGDNRENPLLIKVVKELGKKASGKYANLKIVKIPFDVDYVIEEYDGWEHIAESHRIWD